MRDAWRWAAALVVMGAVWANGCRPRGHDESEQCNPGLDSPQGQGDCGMVPPPPSDGGTTTDDGGQVDAGPVSPTPPDAGTPDAGTQPPDAGAEEPASPDAGTPDAGTPDAGPPPEAHIPFPSSQDWQFFGPQHGGPQRIYGVTADEGGNLWVAGGEEGLFLLQPGATRFRRFTMEDGLRPYGFMADGSAPPGPRYLKAISVAGGPAGTVFVGYEGLPGTGSEHCENNWDGPSPDPARYKSGDADRVTLRPDGTLQVVHYDISSGPDVVRSYPRGREKLCNILRIAYDTRTQSVWFGGNHGFARGKADYAGHPTCDGQLHCSGVEEHTHPALNAWSEDGNMILLTDAYYGVAVHSSGDVFFGGANRSTRFLYGSSGNDFWRAQVQTEGGTDAWSRIDIWPDRVPVTPRPADRVDDHVSGMAVMGDTVWVSSFTRGLARMDAQGGAIHYVDVGVPHLSAVAADPLDGSVWTGARWLGFVYRVKGDAVHAHGCGDFGPLCHSRISDIQVDTSGPRRRILVAFMGSDENQLPGAIGIYTGD